MNTLAKLKTAEISGFLGDYLASANQVSLMTLSYFIFKTFRNVHNNHKWSETMNYTTVKYRETLYGSQLAFYINP